MLEWTFSQVQQCRASHWALVLTNLLIKLQVVEYPVLTSGEIGPNGSSDSGAPITQSLLCLVLPGSTYRLLSLPCYDCWTGEPRCDFSPIAYVVTQLEWPLEAGGSLSLMGFGIATHRFGNAAHQV